MCVSAAAALATTLEPAQRKRNSGPRPHKRATSIGGSFSRAPHRHPDSPQRQGWWRFLLRPLMTPLNAFDGEEESESVALTRRTDISEAGRLLLRPRRLRRRGGERRERRTDTPHRISSAAWGGCCELHRQLAELLHGARAGHRPARDGDEVEAHLTMLGRVSQAQRGAGEGAIANRGRVPADGIRGVGP